MPGAAITEFRQAVRQTVEDEFAPEQLSVSNDKMHEMMGSEGALGAVYPLRERPGEAGIVEAMLVQVQVFDQYDLEIDPAQKVDPAKIERWAWRLQRRMREESSIDTTKVYWYNVAEIIYPPDPTDNITRFVMTLEGFSPNAQLMETGA